MLVISEVIGGLSLFPLRETPHECHNVAAPVPQCWCTLVICGIAIENDPFLVTVDDV
jgi:hypothetical protein